MSAPDQHPPAPDRIDEQRRDDYLGALGFERPVAATRSGLQELHRRHLLKVPFENLDIHLGPSITLDAARSVDKITRRRRGGFCYELNGAFASLLATLGFDVAMVEARVIDGEGRVGIRFDHMCLIVDLGGPILVDVGFGALFDEPKPMLAGVSQHDPAGEFQLVDRGDGWWDLFGDGVLQYRFDRTPRRLHDFEPGRLHHTTSPDSHFTTATVCSRRTDRGRVTIRDARAIETIDGSKSVTELSEAQLGKLYDTWFGIRLSADELATLRSRHPATRA